jgi:molecular chaperone GrpE
VERLERQLEESFSRAQQTQTRLTETHDRLLRTAAELENVKRRAAKEREDLRKFAVEALLKDFLPVGDNLERALDHADQHDPKVVIEGVRLVQKIFEQALGKHGVVGFSAAGKMFDPAVHEALMQTESDLPPGSVVTEMARGYKLHDRLVRPAAVVVAKARESKEPAGPGGSDGANGSGGAGAGAGGSNGEGGGAGV